MTRAEFLRRQRKMHVKEIAHAVKESPRNVLAFERREVTLTERQLQVLAAVLGARCAAGRLLDEVNTFGQVVGINYAGTGLQMLPEEEAPELDEVDLDDVGDNEPTPAGARLSDTK